MSGSVSHLIVPFSLGGCLIGFSIALSIYKVAENFQDLVWPTLLFLSYATVNFSILIIAGQSIETESDKMLSTFMIPKWYTWNKRNRKTFLIMLSNSVAPIKIKFTENVAVNYALGMSICRAIYTMISVFHNVTLN
ncbi:unnamed protein product [Tenebrio molitor]|nr:unnamed protein product [Tenebrio molitor]